MEAISSVVMAIAKLPSAASSSPVKALIALPLRVLMLDNALDNYNDSIFKKKLLKMEITIQTCTVAQAHFLWL